MNVEFIGQLVDSMEEGISRLEQAVAVGDKDLANKLKTFIFDVHKKIADEVRV